MSSSSRGPPGTPLRFPSTSTSTSGMRVTDTTSSHTSTNDEFSTRRLWIGNLDPKLTEFHLLKILQSFGPIQHFDLLFHRTGPHAGKPRGYAFVTFKDDAAAQKCIKDLNSRRVLDRSLSVSWAHQTPAVFQDEEEKVRSKIPALGIKPNEKPISKSKAISAIEAKLKAMERETPSFNLSSSSLQSRTPKSQSSRNSSQTSRMQPYPRKTTQK